MEKWICLDCLKEFEQEPTFETEEYVVKGKKVVIKALKAKCPCCGEYMVNDKITDANLTKAYDAYRKEEHLLFPKEIKKIRQSYGITQVGFSRILGFGDKTIARYENGALQDVAPNNLILLMEKKENFLKLWNMRKDKLDKKDVEAVERKLSIQTITLEDIISRGKIGRPYVVSFDSNFGVKGLWNPKYTVGGVCTR